MNKKQKVYSIFILTFLLLIASAFLSSEFNTVSAATKVATVSLNSTSTVLVKGETTNLKITGTSKKVAWSSTNKSVATVTSSGKVTAVRYGDAYIKATVNNKSYKCKITVMNPAEISFKPVDTIVIVNGTGTNLNPVSDIYSAAVLKKAGITYKVSGNSGVKVSSSGIVTASKAGDFNIVASIHGKKIKTIKMEATIFKGLSISEINVNPFSETNEFVSFLNSFAPEYSSVKVTTSNKLIAEVKSDFTITTESDIIRCEGIYIKGVNEGTCTISVTISGVTKTIKVIVGDGLEKLSQLEAVKNNNFSGYTGNALITLKAIRKFIDDNKLMSDTLDDKEKIMIIQKYLNATYSGKITDATYTGHISQVFLKGAGGCMSYAETFCFISECIGIDVYYCMGTADNRSGNGFAGHAWNKVKVEGKWYYIDTYWNAGLGNFEYFLSKDLWTDHKLEEEGYYYDIWNDNYPPMSFN